MGGLGACSDGGGSADQLCALVGDGRGFTDVFQQGLDPTDTEKALAQLKVASIDLDQLHDAAPSEVRGALRDEIAYVDALTGVLARVDPDDTGAVVAAVNGLRDEREAATRGAARLRTFQTEQCTSPSSG
jgi:hypothetical protein